MGILEELKKKIEKQAEGVHTSILSVSDIASVRDWVKTPALDLNRILSGSLYRGIPSKNLVAIVGPEHTFKSSFMVLCMAAAQKSGFTPIIIDAEGGNTKEFCERWGLDTSNTLYNYTPWIHEIKTILAQIRDSKGEKFIIGIDSVGAIDRYKSFEDALGGEPKADQGLLQKEIRSTLKLLLNICVAQNSIGIACGHLYGSPSAVPMPDQIGGGKAMKLLPSIIVNLKKTPLREGSAKNSKIIGNVITATTLKNRVYPPFQNATISIDYRTGIDKYAGLIDLCIEAGFVEQKGSWYSYGDEKLGQGKINASIGLGNISGVLKDLDKWLETTGYSTINENVKQAEELLIEEEEEKIIEEDIIEEDIIEKKETILEKKKRLSGLLKK